MIGWYEITIQTQILKKFKLTRKTEVSRYKKRNIIPKKTLITCINEKLLFKIHQATLSSPNLIYPDNANQAKLSRYLI